MKCSIWGTELTTQACKKLQWFGPLMLLKFNYVDRTIMKKSGYTCKPGFFVSLLFLLLASSVELVVRHGCTGCRSTWNNKIKWIQIHYLQQLSLDKNTILVFSTVFSKLSCRSTPSSKISAALLYIALPPFQIRETIDFFLFSYYSFFTNIQTNTQKHPCLKYFLCQIEYH